MTACPKPVRIKSKALTDSARGRACTLRVDGMCPPGTVVFCHVRINSGVATKPPDFFGYYGCGTCHDLEEHGHVAAEDVLRAILETQTIMAAEGLLSVKGWKP
jgi:hypothetical protein